MSIGKEEAKSRNDTSNLARPTGIVVDAKTNEVFIGDGYRNRCVIVFDADTGAYKQTDRRDCGRLGGIPDSEARPARMQGRSETRSKQFATVHCIMMSRDNLLYVCDLGNNRIQVFRTDGTFVREGVVAPRTRGFGAVHSLAFSPDPAQRFVYVSDGVNKKIWILQREDLRILGSFGAGGHGGGQLLTAHASAVNSAANVYVGETHNNNRVQRFKFMGMRRTATQ